MRKLILVGLLTLSAQSFANVTDLTIPEERWAAKFTAYVCQDGNTQTASVPSEFSERNVVFTRATTDYSLDNYLFKATFEENGYVCNYSAVMFADNAAWNIKLVQSVAHVNGDDSLCTQGKAFLDNLLTFNNYKYLHGRAAIYVPTRDAAALCGEGNSTVGLHFQVTGKIQK